jgi:cytochrome P450
MAGFLETVFRMRYGSLMKKFEGIPGPTPVYPAGTLGDFVSGNPWDVCANYAKQYGGMTLVWFTGQPRLVLNDPNLIREVMIEKWNDYYKDEPIKALKPVLRNTLFNLNSPEWNTLRKPHAHPLLIDGITEWYPAQFPVIKKVVDKHLQLMLESDRDVDLIDRIQRICFEVFNTVTCGPDFEDGGFDNFYKISEMATFRMKTPQSLLIPPISPSFHQAMAAHYGAYARALAKAKQHPDPNANDLLQIFLRQGPTVSDNQIVDFLSEFHAGGNISSAAAVVNTFQLLNTNPDVAKRVYSDLSNMTRQKPDFDLATLDQHPIVDYALRESLRLMPPVPMFTRNVRKDKTTTLGGRELPPDTVVMVVMKAVQRSADHWKNPDQFDPDRWANGVAEANPIGSDYFFPFGRGARMCAGAQLAMLTMKTILATILAKATVKTSGSFRDVFHCGVIEAKELKGRLIPHRV